MGRSGALPQLPRKCGAGAGWSSPKKGGGPLVGERVGEGEVRFRLSHEFVLLRDRGDWGAGPGPVGPGTRGWRGWPQEDGRRKATACVPRSVDTPAHRWRKLDARGQPIPTGEAVKRAQSLVLGRRSERERLDRRHLATGCGEPFLRNLQPGTRGGARSGL